MNDGKPNEVPEGKPKKIQMGIFTFSCCEDSSILFTELLNDYFFEWRERIDFVEARILRKSKTDARLDVALVEGAIIADEQANELRAIRERSTKLVAFGACACTGMPSAIRNDFDDERKEEIQFILDRFKYADKVRKLSDVVKVDATIPGCPMIVPTFLETLNGIFTEFGFEPVPIKPEHAHP